MKTKYFGLVAGVAMITTPVMANIASQGYVDAQVTDLQSEVGKKLQNTFTDKNMAMTTDGTGAVQVTTVKTNMIEASNVTNAKLAGGIGIDKLELPTKCTSGKTCILVYDGTSQKYTWEEIGRGSDTAPTGGITGAGSSN